MYCREEVGFIQTTCHRMGRWKTGNKAGSLAQFRRLRCWLSEGHWTHLWDLWAENLVDPSGKARVLCCRARKPEGPRVVVGEAAS